MTTTKSRPRRGAASRMRSNRTPGRHRRPQSRRHSGTRPKRAIPTFDPTQFINKNPAEYVEEVYTPKHKFSDFAIDRRIVNTLKALKIESPSPIQDQVITEILEGKDVLGLAETGTGKTAAFLIPLIERKKGNMKSPTLILAPTRELAIQVENELKKLTKSFNFQSVVCVGGTNIGPQIRQLRKHNQFIIGTPGRVKDLIERGNIDPKKIQSVVLDEADRMLDMGFIHDMGMILGLLPKHRHTLFFSATMDEKTRALVDDFMHEPVTISVKKKEVTDSIAQDVVTFDPEQKYETLTAMLEDKAFERVIVFGAMKHTVEKLGRMLNRSGITAESIHGNKSHGQRQRSLKRFKDGQARVLVATDVAARGIHVDNVSHVINYDLPQCQEDYVHRIGRTGRGTKRGIALTFVPKST